jgi:hypothetical protein
MGVFFALARIVPPLYYSHVLPILFALLVIYLAFRIAHAQDVHKGTRLALDALQQRLDALDSFTLTKHCDYAKVLEIADAKGMNKKQKQILQLYFCEDASWAKINTAFSPWSESTTRKFLKTTIDKFNAPC